MKLQILLNEISQDALWNLTYIYNDVLARIDREPGYPNYGLKGIVQMVRQEFFPYSRKGTKKWGVMVWFEPSVPANKIKETEQFIRHIHADTFKKYAFSTEINNRLLKVLLNEVPAPK